MHTQPSPRPSSRLPLVLTVLGAAVLAACAVNVNPKREGFPCNSDGSCENGLVCYQGACVLPAHAGSDGGVTDGGTHDGGTNDGGVTDGGTHDGGANDGGLTDGGTHDGGINDGGTSDGGTNDGGTHDGGTPDGGTVGPAAALMFSVQPSNAYVNGSITPAVEVAVVDANGNLVTTSTIAVTMTLQGGFTGGTLTGVTTVNAQGGIATFSKLAVTTAASNYRLVASGGGFPTVTSNTFAVTACSVTAALTATGPGGGTTVLPWDTITLDGTTTQTCHRTVTGVYSFSGPTGPGGFAPWGNFNPTSKWQGSPPVVHFYALTPGNYVFALSVYDPTTNRTTTAKQQLTIAAFASLPYGAAAPIASSTLALDRTTGNLFIGTNGTGGQYYSPSGTTGTTVVPLNCLTGSAASTAVFGQGRFWVGFSDVPTVDRLESVSTAGNGSCKVNPFTPTATTGANPSRTNSMTISGGQIYLATNVALFTLDLQSLAITEHEFNAFGINHDEAAVGFDSTGLLWVASGNNASPDGTVRTPIPIDAQAPLFNYLPAPVYDGIDTIVAVPAVTTTSSPQVWFATLTNGVIQVPDLASPGQGTQYAGTNGGLPSTAWDQLDGGDYDAATGDVWFAGKQGVLRYKADVGAFATIVGGQAGLTTILPGYDVLFDEGNGRGRILYVATRRGVYSVRTP